MSCFPETLHSARTRMSRLRRSSHHAAAPPRDGRVGGISGGIERALRVASAGRPTLRTTPGDDGSCVFQRFDARHPQHRHVPIDLCP